MTGETGLRALTHGIDEGSTGLGIAADRARFKAHLTLGRVKGAECHWTTPTRMATAAELHRETREFAIRTVDLMRSELGRGRSSVFRVGCRAPPRRGT